MSECQSQPFCDEAKERVKEIEAELADLRRDAERYRKLRVTRFWCVYRVIWDEAYNGLMNETGEELDRIVDNDIPACGDP